MRSTPNISVQDSHYSRKLPYYSHIILDASSSLLFRKLCRHNPPKPTYIPVLYHTHNVLKQICYKLILYIWNNFVCKVMWYNSLQPAVNTYWQSQVNMVIGAKFYLRSTIAVYAKELLLAMLKKKIQLLFLCRTGRFHCSYFRARCFQQSCLSCLHRRHFSIVSVLMSL